VASAQNLWIIFSRTSTDHCIYSTSSLSLLSTLLLSTCMYISFSNVTVLYCTVQCTCHCAVQCRRIGASVRTVVLWWLAPSNTKNLKYSTWIIIRNVISMLLNVFWHKNHYNYSSSRSKFTHNSTSESLIIVCSVWALTTALKHARSNYPPHPPFYSHSQLSFGTRSISIAPLDQKLNQNINI